MQPIHFDPSHSDGISRELSNAISHVQAEGQTQLANAQQAANRFGDRSQQHQTSQTA